MLKLFKQRDKNKPKIFDDFFGDEKDDSVVKINTDTLTDDELFGLQIENNIKAACHKYGQAAISSVKGAVYDYFFGTLPFCPFVLSSLDVTKCKKYVKNNFSSFKYGSLTELIVQFVVKLGVNGQGVVPVDISIPIVRSTDHISRSALESWNIMGSNSCGPNYENVNGLVDYIVQKADGVYVEVVAITFEDGKEHAFARTAGKVYAVKSRVGFSGEIVGSKLILQTGYENRRSLPESIIIDGTVLTLEQPSKLTVSHIKPSSTIEGYIVGVNGIEHKIKYINTVEIARKDKTWKTSDNKPIEILDDDEDFTEGIYEAVYNETCQKYEVDKMRPDKTEAQTLEKINFVNDAVGVDEFAATFRNVDKQEFSNVVDVLCLNDVCKMVCECAKMIGGTLSRKKILTYIYGRHKFITSAQLDEALVTFGIGNEAYFRLPNDGDTFTKFIADSATRYDIFTFARMSKIRVNPYDFAVNCANHINKNVSLHKVMNMVSTGDLMYLYNSISAKVIGGKLSRHKISKPYCPKIPLVNNDDFVGAVVNYLRLNYGKHKVEDLHADVLSGGGPMVDKEFMFNVIKLLVYQLGGEGPMVSVDTWRMICSNLEIMRCLETLRERYNTNGCVGDHENAHVCSTGENFIPMTSYSDDDEESACGEYIVKLLAAKPMTIDNILVAVLGEKFHYSVEMLKQLLYNLRAQGFVDCERHTKFKIWFSKKKDQ